MKTKLEKSNAAHERLIRAHYYAGLYGNDNNSKHLDLYEYHNCILKKQKKSGKVLSSKEKRAIYRYIKSLSK